MISASLLFPWVGEAVAVCENSGAISRQSSPALLSIKAELDNFLSPKAAQLVERYAVIRSPSKHELFIPSWLFYEFIEEMRFRINKGLRLAERAARTMGEEDIKALRQQYREDLRSGILDSKEDLDIVLLAKELSAAVISADEGVKKWADKNVEQEEFHIVDSQVRLARIGISLADDLPAQDHVGVIVKKSAIDQVGPVRQVGADESAARQPIDLATMDKVTGVEPVQLLLHVKGPGGAFQAWRERKNPPDPGIARNPALPGQDSPAFSP